MFVIIMDIGS